MVILFLPKIWSMHLIVGSELSVNKICILFRKMKMINLKLNPNEPIYIWNRSISASDWPKIAYFAKLISNIFRLVDRGHDPRRGIWNDPVCLVCQSILSKFTQRQKTTKPIIKHASALEYEWQKMAAASTSASSRYSELHGGRELGLPTSSSAVHLHCANFEDCFRDNCGI